MTDPETELADTHLAETESVQDAAPPAVGRRRAWTPESDAEVAGLLRRLALDPWLVAEQDPEAVAAARRNEQALRSAVARLGWVLVVERDLVRLRKSPPPRPEQWAAQGPAPLVCSWFFLLAAAAEAMTPRVGLGQLVGAARTAAAEAGIDVLHDIGERRAIVAALRELDRRGVVAPIDGDLERYVRDEQAPVLLAVHHTRLTHLLANPGTIDPSEDPRGWLAQAHREDDPARRMRRRLIDDTCVHVTDLDPPEGSWLSQRVRGDDGAPLAAAFGLALERRAEGAAFVVPDHQFRHARELGPFPFPAPGTVGHAALLLCDHASVQGRTDGGPGPGWRTLNEIEIASELRRLCEQHGSRGWSAELTGDPTALADRVAQLLEGANLLRRDPDWHFAPPTGRWAEPSSPPAPRRRAPRTPRGRVVGPVTAADQDLFNSSDEDSP